MNENDVVAFIVDYAQRKGPLPTDVPVRELDFLASGHIDSIGLIRFLAKLEERFAVTLADADLLRPEFRTIGGLAGIVTSAKAAG